MRFKFKYWLIVLCSFGCFAMGYKFGQVGGQIKNLEKTKVVEQRDINQKKIITENPNGKKVTEIITVSKTISNKDTTVSNEQNIINSKWSVGAYLGFNGAENRPIIITIDRRIIGSLFLGVYGRVDNNNYEGGMGLRFEF